MGVKVKRYYCPKCRTYKGTFDVCLMDVSDPLKDPCEILKTVCKKCDTPVLETDKLVKGAVKEMRQKRA